MNRRIFLSFGSAAALAIAAAGFLFGRGGRPENLTLASLSGESLASDPSVLLVDIRRPEEWQDTGVVEGALLITYADRDSFLSEVRPHLQEGQSLALICRTGNRTSRASRQIAGLVDVPVIDVAGGMVRVLAEGYRPVTPTRDMGCTVC
ncbi:rhodanese-like domain-containing protein [Nioella aestuarii]|uniref:rhodanese-like domain-containing protein n=1 Tax=Nioella aestuarii TaxID=1662864 RepID=UPI003D7F2F8B